MIEEAIARYIAGQSSRQASAGICAATTLTRRMRKLGIPVRSRQEASRTIPEDRLEVAIRRYVSGMALNAAAKGICSDSNLYHHLDLRGLYRPKKPVMTNRKVDMLVARYESGMSIEQARKGICAKSTARKYLDERGVTVRSCGGNRIGYGPRDPERTMSIYRRHRAGETARQIGNSIGLNPKTVLHHVWTAESMLLDQQARRAA